MLTRKKTEVYKENCRLFKAMMPVAALPLAITKMLIANDDDINLNRICKVISWIQLSVQSSTNVLLTYAHSVG